jgi:integrase
MARGHVRKHGAGYAVVIDLGEQTARRCEAACKGQLFWASDGGAPKACPKCSGGLVEVRERRRQWHSGYPTVRAAEQARTDLLRQKDTGLLVDPTTLTVQQYLLDEWLPSIEPTPGTARRRSQVEPATWDSYRRIVRAYLVPSLGPIRLQKLTRRDINALYDRLERTGGRSGKGLAPKTMRNVQGVVHKALSDALQQELVSRNVADKMVMPELEKEPSEWWSVEELRQFLEHVREDRLYALWLLFATTGMRRGEALGLAWDDINLDTGEVFISWTLGSIGGKVTWKKRPKTKAGRRRIALDPATVDALRSWRQQQRKERLAAGPEWISARPDWRGVSRDSVVFTRASGAALDPKKVTDAFNARGKAAGLRRIRLHDVRHTYASAALKNATSWAEVKVISERLGHASVGITIDTYAHVLPSQDRETADTLARVILGGGDAR